jgi:ABC-2 type transport system permease protein
MMARIPFGVPLWQVGVSMLILALTIFFIIKGAAKIYRTGILMYGQKITYKTLWKWLRH